MRVSLYQNIKVTTPKVSSKCVFKVLQSIKDGTYKNEIAKIRIESDKTERNKIKAKLHYVTFCGTFSSRSNANLKQHSGLACLDFDDVKDLQELKKRVEDNKYTFSSFTSPSGNGLKVLCKIPFVDNNDDYQDYYVELMKEYEQYEDVDPQTKAIAQACYLSYDDKIYINPDSELFTEKFKRPLPKQVETINIPIDDKNAIAERLEKWFQKRWTSTNRNTNLHAYARQMNAFGVDKTICEQYLLRYEMTNFKAKEIQALINSAYRYTEEFNTRFFEDKKKTKSIKNLVIAGQGETKILSKIKDIPTENLKKEIEKHVSDLKNDEFWYYTDKDVIKLATFRFLNYLENNNISKYYPDENSGIFHFIKKENNFVKLFDDNKIKDFTLRDLRNRGEIDAFELMANNTLNFKSSYLSMIKTTDVKINRDTKTSSYIYYKNKAVKTNKNGSELIDYKDIKDLIWTNQVIDRDIKLKNESDGEFKRFIWLVSGQSVDRYYTLKSVIGYLMHSYQNDSKPKAIIFNDEMISEDVPNGGSGKGLIHKAIGQIKNVVTEDGKKFDPRGQFAYQKVNKDTQIFLMDDVPKNFSFESLFSIVTEGMTVEKKGKDAYQIPFKESPKISITTNYTIKGEGASHYRRVFEVEIANYFNDNHTPEDEFGHQFFTEWDDEEWAKFDNFMLRCIEYFLKNGLVESEKVNLDFRKLKNNVGAEFMEFMESKTLKDFRVSRKEFRDEFNRAYPNIAKYNTAQKFNGKVKEYCSYFNLFCEETKFNGVIHFEINDPNNKEEDINFDELGI